MNNAFLVRVSISLWTARRMDKSATKDAKAHAGASDKAAVKVYKSVIAADELDAINTIANAARSEHKKRTVPYSYDGPGMITTEGYASYKAAMAQYEKAFHAAVARFNAVYEQERERARSYLGTMFNAADYPAINSLGSKFSFAVHAEPMPQAEHFAPVGLAPELVKDIKADIVANNVKALDNANATAWSRVLEVTEKLRLRLQEFSTGAVTKFYDSWHSNVIELAGTIPSINVAADPDLTRIGQKLAALTAYSTIDLKSDANLRADCIKQVGAILASIDQAHRQAA